MDDRAHLVLGIVAPHPPIMVPAVGGPDAEVTAETMGAMRRAAAALDSLAPDSMVVISPHAPGFANALTVDTSPRLSGTLARFGAPATSITTTTDVRLARSIIETLADDGIGVVDRSEDPRTDPGELDHGVLVPLTFLDPSGRIPLVVVSLSGLTLDEHRRAGACIAAAAASLGRRVAFLASGDLSHRLTRRAPAGFHPRAEEFDRRLVELFRSSRLDDLVLIDPDLIEDAGECGLRSFIALSGAMPSARSVLLSYEAPWGVGYLTAVVGGEDTLRAVGLDTGSHPLVSLARASIEAHVRDEPLPEAVIPSGLPVPARAGAFVSLHREGRLRGCIGTIVPTEGSLAREVAANAIKAATEDPRFPPLDPEELSDLDVKVDVLHAAEPATADDLDPHRYGVIVTSGWRRGLLLPDLEGVDTVDDQLAIALRKAGIDPSDRYSVERFRVDRYT